VTPARARAIAHDPTGIAGSRPEILPGDGLRAMRDLEEDLAVNVVSYLERLGGDDKS
jgi:hypothetical protein